MPQKLIWRKSFTAFSTSRKPAVDGVWLQRFDDFVPVGHELHALQLLARVVENVHILLAVAYSRVFTTRRSCLVLSKNFNTMSAIFIHQPPTLPQKIDSRESLFWCKGGVACECSEMNIYWKRTPFVPHLGLFAAKCTAIWSKTQCNMPQNAVHFGAKRKVKWCKIQCVLMLNAGRKA